MRKLIILTCCVAASISIAGTDYQCMTDCTSRYSRAYCQSVCAVGANTSNKPIYASPVTASQEARTRRLEQKRIELEIQRLELENARLKAEVEKLKSENKALTEQAKPSE